jgi:hypothetical protein
MSQIRAVFASSGGAVVAGGNDGIILYNDGSVALSQAGGALGNGLRDIQIIVLLCNAVHNCIPFFFHEGILYHCIYYITFS